MAAYTPSRNLSERGWREFFRAIGRSEKDARKAAAKAYRHNQRKRFRGKVAKEIHRSLSVYWGVPPS